MAEKTFSADLRTVLLVRRNTDMTAKADTLLERNGTSLAAVSLHHLMGNRGTRIAEKTWLRGGETALKYKKSISISLIRTRLHSR